MADCHSIPAHRVCTKCSETKELQLFGNASRGRYGKKSVCKACERAYMVANKDRINALSLERYHKSQATKKAEKASALDALLASPVKTCARCQTIKEKTEFKRKKDSRDGLHCHCMACCNQINREHRQKNPEMAAEWSRRWSEKNPDKLAAKRKRFLDRNPGYNAERQKEFAEKNPERAREIARRSRRKRMTVAANRIHNTIGNAIRNCIGKGGKSKRTVELIGYEIVVLMQHLERQFRPGMSWENFGEWHIDHIVPLSSFSITDERDEALKAAWCLSNLRPLWAKENLKKNAKRLFLI